MAEAINAALVEAMEARPETILSGRGRWHLRRRLPDHGGTPGAFRRGPGDRHTVERIRHRRDCHRDGNCRSATIPEIQFDGFVYPAFDQIVSHLGRFRYRTRGVSLPIVVRFPSGAGIGAHEHHCDSPEAYFVHAPGLVVVCPSNPTDAKGLLAAALEGDDPVIFLEPKVIYRAGREDVPTSYYTIPIGRARIAREGTDLTIVTYGGMVPVALKAAEQTDWSSEIIDLRTLFPWDRETVLASVEKTGRLLVVQEAQGSAGVGADVSAVVAEKALYSLRAPIVRITGLDTPWPQFAIERHALITPKRVVAGITQAMER